jgi:release factor glutamine methyltransferase
MQEEGKQHLQKNFQKNLIFPCIQLMIFIGKLNLQNQIAGIVSNPPYIPSHEVLNLQPEVTNHEPHLALDGGDDGLDAIRELVNTARQYLISGGFWIVELMAGQSEIVRSLLQVNGNYTNIQIHQDYSGILRFISASRK